MECTLIVKDAFKFKLHFEKVKKRRIMVKEMQIYQFNNIFLSTLFKKNFSNVLIWFE
jgi:hypothetical protein